jgi:hypothetical protein
MRVESLVKLSLEVDCKFFMTNFVKKCVGKLRVSLTFLHCQKNNYLSIFLKSLMVNGKDVNVENFWNVEHLILCLHK